jgi:hypothetical protein
VLRARPDRIDPGEAVDVGAAVAYEYHGMAQIVGDSQRASELQERAWRPAAHAAARLELVGDEDPGTMQHFTMALLLGDLIARLHAAFLVSVMGTLEASTAQRHAYTLVRASGAGDWLSALSDCMTAFRLVAFPEPVHAVVKWPAVRPDAAEDGEGFAQMAERLAELAARLRLEEPKRMKRTPVPRTIMEWLLQVRNKTTHGAYDSSFYQDHVDVVEAAVWWLLANTPLWDVQLVQVTKASQGRLLHGTRPRKAIALAGEFHRDQLLFTFEQHVWQVTPLIRSYEGHTYVANGSWRAGDASAEFLCHSLAAQDPGQGTLRIKMPDLARPPLPTVGQVVDGHYRISTVLGQGEDAVVYLACDTDEGTEYVLKAFREPREAFDQRRTEFTALQRINHRGIPRVHEIHSWEHPFHLRMDHVPGVALKARREEFQADLRGVGALGIAVCEALDAVHSAGFVHRDVAPDNILIPDRPNDAVRLVDFDAVAEEGVVGPAGTSLYRPPESELGTPWTKSSDVYSLGVLLFELLTGRLPYETAEAGARRKPVKPTAAERAAFGGILNVLLKAASPIPHARYPDARHLLRALKREHKRAAGQG